MPIRLDLIDDHKSLRRENFRKLKVEKVMKKVVVIGPVYPFKGGIAHYTGMMVRSLKKIFDVHTVSFKMQYPRLLFKKEQYDYDNQFFRIEEAKFLINTANPFNWINVVKKIKEINPDYIILQWWHPYFAPCYMGLLGLLKKYPSIFICHNILPHERFPFDAKLIKLALKNTNGGYITHALSETTELLKLLPSARVVTTVLPTYNAFKLQNMTKEEARNQLSKFSALDSQKKLLLFFGFVREYKGLKHIINAMPEIMKYDKNIDLMIVGEFDNDKEKYLELIKETHSENNIHIVDGYIPDKEIEPYFAACDLVVLPYESATQSAIVQIAYGFDKPVIATDVGGLPEVVLDGKTGYITKAKDHHALSEAVIRFFEDDKAVEFENNVRGEAYKYSWDRMNEVIQDLTERIDKDKHAKK